MNFTEITDHCLQLASLYAARDEMFEGIRRAFHLEWTEKPAGDWIKATMSPTAYNAVIGAVRLMTSTEPQITAAGDRLVGDKIERAARAMWDGASRVNMRPPHYDLVFSGVLYGEVAASVSKTADLLAFAEENQDNAMIARARYMALEAPYLFETYNPATCYPDRDVMGLRGMLRKYKTTQGEFVSQWGGKAMQQVGGENYNRLLEIEVCDWTDWQTRCVWRLGSAEPVYHEDHGLPFLPVSHAIVEGSYIFDLPERQRLPMLYGYYKSGMWQRENLSLTTVFTLIHALATNPQLVLEGSQDDTPIRITREVPSGVTRLPPGTKLAPLNEKVLDPSLMTGLGLAQQYAEESTISKQALGAPPKDALAFSAISLLVQSGRLPLMGVKQVVGGVVGYLLNNALRWLKEDGANGEEAVEIYSLKAGSKVDITPDDIPERAVVTVGLEPDLPTDKMNLANVAELLVRNKLATREWVRANVLGIGNSEEQDRGIWHEGRLDAEFQNRITEIVELKKAEIGAQVQMMMAQMAQAQQPGGPGGPGPGGPGAGAALPPPAAPGQPELGPPAGDQVTPYPPGGVGEGAPLTAPLQPAGAGGGPMM